MGVRVIRTAARSPWFLVIPPGRIGLPGLAGEKGGLGLGGSRPLGAPAAALGAARAALVIPLLGALPRGGGDPVRVIALLGLRGLSGLKGLLRIFTLLRTRCGLVGRKGIIVGGTLACTGASLCPRLVQGRALVLPAAVENLVHLLICIIVGLVIPESVDGLLQQVQGLQQPGIVIGVIPDGQGCVKYRLLLPIDQGAVIQRIPADIGVRHIENAVGGNVVAGDPVGEHRPLCVHKQFVGQGKENKLVPVGLRQALVVGIAVRQVEPFITALQIDLIRNQYRLLIQKAQSGTVVDPYRKAFVDSSALLAHEVPAEGGINYVIIAYLHQVHQGAVPGGQESGYPRLRRHRKAVLSHDSQRLHRVEGKGGKQAHQHDDSREYLFQVLHGITLRIAPVFFRVRRFLPPVSISEQWAPEAPGG